MPWALSSNHSPQTDTVLVSNPRVDRNVFVKAIKVSSDTLLAVTFSSGAQGAVKEVATVDRGTSTGGTFTLTVDAVTTAAIAFDANAAAVKAALELLATVVTVTVTGTGTVGDPWICTFDDPIQSLAVSGSGTSLTGGDSTLTVTETTAGSIGNLRWANYCLASTEWYTAAPEGEVLFLTAGGEDLTYTTSAAGHVFVSVVYEIR